MNWGALFALFGLAFIKFMFAPFSGPLWKLSFIETYLASVAGGIVSAAIFYFSAEFFLIRSHKKKVERYKLLIEQGVKPVYKRKFTPMNKFIVRIKRTLGIIGTSFWAPFFLSVPIGSIVTAKFYGHHKKTFPLIVLGMFINAAVTTGLAYILYG